MRPAGLAQHAGDDVRVCITRLQNAAFSLGEVPMGQADGLESTIHLLWHLSELARSAESEIAKILKQLRENNQSQNMGGEYGESAIRPLAP